MVLIADKHSTTQLEWPAWTSLGIPSTRVFRSREIDSTLEQCSSILMDSWKYNTRPLAALDCVRFANLGRKVRSALEWRPLQHTSTESDYRHCGKTTDSTIKPKKAEMELNLNRGSFAHITIITMVVDLKLNYHLHMHKKGAAINVPWPKPDPRLTVSPTSIRCTQKNANW